MSNSRLKDIVDGEGSVIDVFISRKLRKSTRYAFGLVRFNRFQEAKNAIKNLDGYEVRGYCLRVSMAKFNKGGSPFNV